MAADNMNLSGEIERSDEEVKSGGEHIYGGRGGRDLREGERERKRGGVTGRREG